MAKFEVREVIQTIRPNIGRRRPYVSGAQKDFWVKANQNECPYDASPQVYAAIAEVRGVNRYPNRDYPRLKTALSKYYGVPIEFLVVADGSDEILSIINRTFVDAGSRIGTTKPTYSMIPVDAEEQAADYHEVKLKEDGTLPVEDLLEIRPKLTVVVNPGTPYGILTAKDKIEELAEGIFPSPVIVDEAYMDFANPSASAIDLVERYPNLIVTRTLSKAFGIAGLRVGCGIAHPGIAAYLEGVRQPFPIAVPSEVGAIAALTDRSYSEYIRKAIIAGREYLTHELKRMKGGQAFDVLSSQANFVFPRCKISGKGKEIFERLDERGIGVRWFDDPGLSDGVRIAVSKLEDDARVVQEIEKLL